MKTMAWVLALLWSGTLLAAGEADKADKVLDCMRKNVPESLRVQDVEFSTADAGGITSLLKGRLYAERQAGEEGEGQVRAMLHIKAPPNLSGAAYLIREKDENARDGMYVYLPSVRRVRRVSGSIADGGLMGTSFSYADFKQLQNTFGEVSATLEGSAEIDKRPTHIVAFRPISPNEGGYALVRSWIDVQSCVPLKAEFYDGQTLRKRMTSPAAALKQAESYWYPSVVEMQDMKDKLRTTLRVLKVSADKDISGGYFDPQTFYQR